jgi:hypothetical protein
MEDAIPPRPEGRSIIARKTMIINRISRYASRYKKYKTIHNLIAEEFPQESIPSLETDHFFFIGSNKNIDQEGVYNWHTDDDVKDNETCFLLVNVAFCNRGREKKLNPRLSSSMAIDRFCTMAALEPQDNVSSAFLGIVKAKKFSIENAFRITGEFKIKNARLLKDLLYQGIGSRKSYGFGLILISKQNPFFL